MERTFDRRLNSPAGAVDLSAMRASLIMTALSAFVVIVLMVLGARACTGGNAGPLSPLEVSRNGFHGLCANQQATAAAAGDTGSTGADGTLLSPDQEQQLHASDPSGLQALQHAVGGPLLCPTTTKAAP